MTDIVAGNVKKVVADTGAGRSDMYRVPLEFIRVRPGDNAARESDPDLEDHIAWLTASIVANGLYKEKPLVALPAADGFWYLSDGHCRHKAILRANEQGKGIEFAYVIAEDKSVSDEDRKVGKVTYNNGRTLTPYGEGMICKDLLGLGLDEKAVAKRTGFALQKVQNLLGLVGAPKEVRDMVTTGRVSSTMAIATLAKEGGEAVAKLKEAVKVADAKGKKKVMPKDLPKEETVILTAQQEAFASANTVRAKAEPMRSLPTVDQIHAEMTPGHRSAISKPAIQIVLDAILKAVG